MFHHRVPRALLLVAALLPAALLLACSDDDPSSPGPLPPENSPWVEVELPAELPAGALTSIALRNNSSVAGGTADDGSAILLENSSQGWRVLEIDPKPQAQVWGLAIDGFGKRVLVGFTSTLRQVVLTEDENFNWSAALPAPAPAGALLCVDVDDTGEFLAAGTQGSSLAAWTGAAGGSWSPVSIPTPGDPNDKALVDLAFGAGAWVACGYDDGGEGTIEKPYSLLMVDEGSGWELIAALCGGCGNQEYEAVAVSDQGTILLGGAVTDFAAGSEDEYTAFLRRYERDIEEWTEVVLPDPGALDRVNEILLVPGGDIYLACGESGEHSLVRLPAGGTSYDPSNLEWHSAQAQIFGLAASGAGTVYAVGAKSEGGTLRPFMLSRDPSAGE